MGEEWTLGYFFLLEVTTLAIVGLEARDFLPALRGAEAAKSGHDFLWGSWYADESPAPPGSNRFRPPSSPESFIKGTYNWSKEDHEKESAHHKDLSEKNPTMSHFHMAMSLAHQHMASGQLHGAVRGVESARREHGDRRYEIERRMEYGEGAKSAPTFLPALRRAS